LGDNQEQIHFQKENMNRVIVIAGLVVVLTSIQGCATKTYGRQGSLSTFEKDTMTCREIDLDLARTRGFVEHVNKESEFSGKDVLAFLGDFGIGNNMEKSAALESASTRITNLAEMRKTKQCAPSPM
jgi:hypothetical protein